MKCPNDPPEVRADAELIAAGWTRRFLADPVRLEEIRKLYVELGFDVRAERPHPDDFAPTCGDCPEDACRTYVMIYTRPKTK